MINRICRWGIGSILAVLLVFCGSSVFAATAQEILKQVAEKNFGEAFRIALTIETTKGSKVIARHSLWLMGKVSPEKSSVFLEFDRPEESKGLRFLFKVEADQKPKAYMYLPATGKTLPLGLDDSGVNIGDTGLAMEDIQSLVPNAGDKAEIVKEEKIGKRDCYVIKVISSTNKPDKIMWVSKEDLFVIQSKQIGKNGKPDRIFKVVDFFKTQDGKTFPRAEEITIPDKGIKVRVTQESAVFGIEIPSEVFDPKKFGKFPWRV